ncbi:hypothetical protein [Porphyrobacter sp. YT40]|uniref:hypothetical protein n=1 Tax=Porphyrobacter sp. YT40 TaxID=2547601 RepID=UPI00114129E6|nr:hypothetical protein [Porphyrobacter sp. YT40]QDH33192.1 hypothetical protein E2E27_01875 [Porphyrobacter sp. YT40]
MPRLPITAAPLLLLVLSACGSERASAPGGVSPGEAKQLEDAASMLDERQLPPEALPTDVPPPTAPATAAPAAELTGDAAPVRP